MFLADAHGFSAVMPSLDIPTTDDAGSSQTIAVLASGMVGISLR